VRDAITTPPAVLDAQRPTKHFRRCSRIYLQPMPEVNYV
jgi:hypothetical protein